MQKSEDGTLMEDYMRIRTLFMVLVICFSAFCFTACGNGHNSMGSVTIAGKKYDIATTTELVLYSENINDTQFGLIAPEIAKLVNLKRLVLDINYISDLTPLSDLTNLEELYMTDNEIQDITPLSGLTNLKKLDLIANNIKDITPLKDLVNLEYLVLGTNHISDISPLANLTNLKKLDLYNNPVSDATILFELSDLRDLDIRHTLISEIDIVRLKARLPDCSFPKG